MGAYTDVKTHQLYSLNMCVKLFKRKKRNCRENVFPELALEGLLWTGFHCESLQLAGRFSLSLLCPVLGLAGAALSCRFPRNMLPGAGWAPVSLKGRWGRSAERPVLAPPRPSSHLGPSSLPLHGHPQGERSCRVMAPPRPVPAPRCPQRRSGADANKGNHRQPPT